MKLKEVTREQLSKLVKGFTASTKVYVVVDVGATNTRLGFMTDYEGENATIPFWKFKVKKVTTLCDMLSSFADEFLPSSVEIQFASINIPGPTNGFVGGPIANYEGSTDEKMVDVAKLPSSLFPVGRTRLLNDLEAAAFGVLTVQELGMFKHYFRNMWKGTSAGHPGHILVIAPGTGLGNALLHYHSDKKEHSVLPLEFGHTNISSYDSTQAKFLADYAKAMAKERGNNAPEYDDVVSGRGLERLYFHRTNGSPTNTPSVPAEKVSALAKGDNPDPDAVWAMEQFNDYIMHFASQMSMGFVPTTVLLIGDNIVKNGEFYERPGEAWRMRKQLLKHTTERMGFMSRVTVDRQIESINMNLLGCAFVCAHNSSGSTPLVGRSRSKL